MFISYSSHLLKSNNFNTYGDMYKIQCFQCINPFHTRIFIGPLNCDNGLFEITQITGITFISMRTQHTQNRIVIVDILHSWAHLNKFSMH